MVKLITKINKIFYLKFIRIVGYSDKITSRSLYGLFVTAFFLVAFVFCVNLFKGSNNFGEWGDFFGGVLNPLLTFLMFMGLLITIVVQQKEMRISREEFKKSTIVLDEQSKSLIKQNFESTYFQAIHVHTSIKENIQVYIDGEDAKGRMAFERLIEKFNRPHTYIVGDPSDLDGMSSEEKFEIFHASYDAEIGHYFRNLYHIVNLVEVSNIDNKEFYFKYLFSQLSSYEIYLLFYNCLSAFGEEKFKPLVEKHGLMEHLPSNLSPLYVDLVKYAPSAYGDNDYWKSRINPETDEEKYI